MYMSKIVLVDGHSILNRAYYGVPDLSNAEGLHTNAVYGFLNIMFKILDEEGPEYMVVAFDVKGPTFRHEIYKEYKGTRKPMPEELREQVPVMKEVLTAMGIKIMEKQGLEADDILGTLAKRSEKEGLEVALISGDRDLLQIASEHIKIRIPKTKGGKTEIEDYYAKDVEEKYQVNPIQFIELKALMGDASDNIPGVPKVGEKTATELMVRYGSLEGIYEHVEDITKKSIKESLITNRALADLSKVLATINIESDIEFNYEDAALKDFYTEEAYRQFKRLEFKNMLSRFKKEPLENKQKDYFKEITDFVQAEAIFSQARDILPGKRIGFDVIEDSKKDEDFVGISLALSEKEIYFIKAEGFLTKEYLIDKLADLAANVPLASFDIKRKYSYISTVNDKNNMNDMNTNHLFDILIAAYLLNPLKNDYAPEDIAQEYLGLMIPGRKQLFGKEGLKGNGKNRDKNRDKEVMEYACFLAYVEYMAAEVLEEKLVQCGMDNLMHQIEMPLSYVLYDMEKEGILVKPDELKAYGEALNERIDELEKEIHRQSGSDFNINSPKQLGEVLFEKMGLPGGKKTKTGYSTAADVLDKLAPEHPIVSDILEYRGITKLKSTYAEGLAAYIEEDSRIHTNFNQTITATGRISSTEPNLQNIPMRMELGRMIRKVFVPKDGFLFIDADYSQIELRVLAHMSEDEQLREAYRMEEDIHRITASKVFHTPFAEVTDLQRRNAKAVNFGIVYGISSFGLSQDLSISRKEAAEYIEQYFKTYPKVKGFLDQLVENAKEKGYVTTMFGRRRPVPELSSGNFMQRSFGERVAMNSPIQGTAADIIKIAMIRVWKRLRDEGLRSKLILQVHDELLIETAKEEAEQVGRLLEEEMQRAAELSVALEIDKHAGENWYEAK